MAEGTGFEPVVPPLQRHKRLAGARTRPGYATPPSIATIARESDSVQACFFALATTHHH